MMTRSAKKKQQQALEMRNKMEPGSGIRTIGGMYALVKAVNEESVELEVAPGVFAIYAKNAIAVVMDGAEYNRIVHGDEIEDDAADDAVAVDAADEPTSLDKATTSLDKTAAEDAPADKAEPAFDEPAADKGVTAK
jgi:preprotein translocase subunit YajC